MSETQLQVSVVMAVYNGMPYVQQAVQSILAQTMPDFEFLIINDASTDKTADTIRQMDDPRIRLIDLPENGGQTPALNQGLRLTKAPFIARQDADDVSKPERLAAELEFLAANPDHLMVAATGDLIDDKGNITSSEVKPSTHEEILAAFAENYNPIFHGSVMFRREVLDRVGHYREGFRTSQDYDYWMRISEKGKIANLTQSLYQYRMHAGQMTFTRYYRMKAEWRAIFKLADVRTKTGDDSEAYETMCRELDETFQNFVPTRKQQNRAMAELWRGRGVSYMKSGRYPSMMYCLLRAFLYEPGNPDFWQGVRNHIPFLKG